MIQTYRIGDGLYCLACVLSQGPAVIVVFVPGVRRHYEVLTAESMRKIPAIRKNDYGVDPALPSGDKLLKTPAFRVMGKFGQEALFPSLVGVTIKSIPLVLLSPKRWNEWV